MPGFLAETLTWPANRHYVTDLKTARSWSVPPLTIIAGKEGGWNETNRKLAKALTVLEEEACNSCKTPLWHAYSTNNHIQFEVKTSHCYACAALEKYREEHKKEAKPGQIHYVKATTVFKDEPLPSRYESYAREAGKK
jgi:hypothetical protein